MHGLTWSRHSFCSADLLRPDEFQSLPLNAAGEERISFLLLDEEEKLQVANETILAEKLGCDLDHTQAKVRLLGSMPGLQKFLLTWLFLPPGGIDHREHGGGEISYSQPLLVRRQGRLQHFVGPEQVRGQSDVANENEPNEGVSSSSTFGVWAAFQQLLGVIVLDTEGMLGLSNKENQKKRSVIDFFVTLKAINEGDESAFRQLLKILAFSDVVVYKTRAERLGNDLFNFLDDASKAFNLRFSEELK